MSTLCLLMDVFQEAPLYHVGVSAFLCWFVLWVALHPSYFPNESDTTAEEDVQGLVAEWSPEPLVAAVDPRHRALNPWVVTKKVRKVIDVDDMQCLNFATHDYLNFIGHQGIEEKAIETIAKYGVGTCGPRGFYGTFDVHLELEKRLSTHMGMQEAVLYSYGFSTVASAIPAYAKKDDIIFADEKVNFAIQKGLDASRSCIRFFKHNNTKHLEKLLMEQRKRDEQNPNLAGSIRRFLIVEGIYINTGEICPLPALMALRKKYRLRIFIDESVSFGTLGETGRGVTEYFDVSRDDVDLIMCSMERSLATIGGFCVGSSFVVEHQRLSGLGYCFSASLPPLLTVAALEALDIMTKDPSIFRALKRCCEKVHRALVAVKGLKNISHVHSPVKHLVVPPGGAPDRAAASDRLEDIAKYCVQHQVALVVPSYLEAAEKFRPEPSIRVTVHNQLTDDMIQTMQNVLIAACAHVLEGT